MTEGETITQLMSLYALAIDSKQWRLFDRVFTPDVVADYPGSRWENLKSWKEDFEAAHEGYDVTQHLVVNLNWHISGDTGQAVSQAHFHLIRWGFPGGDMAAGGAWYDDELRKTADGWRISKRMCRVSWLSGNAGVMPGGGSSLSLVPMSQGVKEGTLNFVRALEG
jgi:SnoaL-like domain